MRIKILILSTLLITLISGVLYYRSLTQISLGKNASKLDIDELRTIDLQISNTAFMLRQNLNADLTDLQEQKVRIKELQELITDINKSTPELKSSVDKIRAHFQAKQKSLTTLEAAIVEARTNINLMLPTYTEMEKKNIKFVLDKRDFYRECLLDIYMFIAFSHKENQNRVSEDLKVLSQIVNFATTPIVEVQKFAKQMEIISIKIKQIDHILLDLKEVSIQNEVKVIATYYQDSMEEQNKQSENLLSFVVVAIGVYIVFMIILLLKK